LELKDCKNVEGAWDNACVSLSNNISGVLIKEVAGSLTSWSRNFLGDMEKRIKKMQKELDQCQRGTISRESMAREEVLWFKLDRMEEQLDIYWKNKGHM
jgi:hypothetical protein